MLCQLEKILSFQGSFCALSVNQRMDVQMHNIRSSRDIKPSKSQITKHMPYQLRKDKYRYIKNIV